MKIRFYLFLLNVKMSWHCHGLFCVGEHKIDGNTIPLEIFSGSNWSWVLPAWLVHKASYKEATKNFYSFEEIIDFLSKIQLIWIMRIWGLKILYLSNIEKSFQFRRTFQFKIPPKLNWKSSKQLFAISQLSLSLHLYIPHYFKTNFLAKLPLKSQ